LANITKVYTGAQINKMYRDKILASSDLTDFNDGSVIKALIQSNSDIISHVMMDTKNAIYVAIPYALFEGLGFTKKAANNAIGYIRPYRTPAFTIAYSGVGTSALLTISGTTFSVPVTGAPGDALSLAFATYPKTSDLVTYIDAQSNWSATLYKDVDSDTEYLYSGSEIVGSLDFELNSGFDIMLQTDVAVQILQGYSISVDEITIITTADATMLAGESDIVIASEAATTGVAGNIAVNAIDTERGKGFVNTQITGINFVINDSAFSGGSIAETESQREVRFSEAINGLNAGTERGIIAEIKKIDGVLGAGMRTNYPIKGTNTLIVDDGSGTISPALDLLIDKAIEGDPDDFENFPGKGTEGIGYIKSPPVIVNASLSITIYRLSSVVADLDQMEVDAKTAIEQYINTLALGHDVVLSEVIRKTKNANAAIYDAVITSPAVNIPVGENEFAKTGAGYSGVITVVAVIKTSP